MSSFKVVLVGDSGVGKTSLSNMFVKQEFNPTQPTTMGAAFQTKHLKVDGRQITFNVSRLFLFSKRSGTQPVKSNLKRLLDCIIETLKWLSSCMI